MKYFLPPFTPENIERQYKALAKILHPDSGGSDSDFAELGREKILAEKISQIHKGIGEKFKQGKKIKMLSRKKLPRSNTSINFIIDPDKVLELIKEIKKIVR